VSYFSAWINQIIEASPASRNAISLEKLKNLSAGISEENLSMVCDDIGIKPDVI